MRAIMVMFDSLNRHMLPPYNPDTFIKAPNFARLAERTVTFDRSYVCSMPCMPARRDIHTGRPNFLHCGWGPLEPFDDSVPEMLKKNGTYTHLSSDHYHYWEDGGSTYHGRYSSWEFFRGQEGDPFIGHVAEPDIPENINGKGQRSDWVNRMFIKEEPDFPQTQTFDAGVKFIDRNHAEGNWFIQIECFDPHEPFSTPDSYKEFYPKDDSTPLFDWPAYREVTEEPHEVEKARNAYAALVTMCDHNLGRILDAMDRHNMWNDTMLIVCTDHGFMLGEHQCWAKNWPPLYDEIAHTPFFVWDPRQPDTAGQRRNALIQPSIDLGPTLLDFFGMQPTKDMLGKNLAPAIADDTELRECLIYGYHNQHVNVVDSRYKYMRQPVMKGSTYNHTLMPCAMRGFKFRGETPMELAGPFSFTKGSQVLRLGHDATEPADEITHRLFDLQEDPHENNTIEDAAVEQMMIDKMTKLMAEADAPPEMYDRLGVARP